MQDPCAAHRRLASEGRNASSRMGRGGFHRGLCGDTPKRAIAASRPLSCPKGTAGLDAGPAERTMGLKGGHVFTLNIDCHCPTTPCWARRAGVSHRHAGAGQWPDRGRGPVPWPCRRGDGCRHGLAKDRVIGGQPLTERQGIRWMIADMGVAYRSALCRRMPRASAGGPSTGAGGRFLAGLRPWPSSPPRGGGPDRRQRAATAWRLWLYPRFSHRTDQPRSAHHAHLRRIQRNSTQSSFPAICWPEGARHGQSPSQPPRHLSRRPGPRSPPRTG